MTAFMIMKTRWKKLLALMILLIAMLVIAIISCNRTVVNSAKHKAFDEIDSIKPAEVGLLLGTAPQTRIGGRMNMFFKYRIDAAEELYNAGKIKYILISGDENSLDGVNEPECMKDSLMARGIPENMIFIDGKGFRTLDAVVRMSKVFGVRIFTIISQRFHNERALYLAEHLGLDIEDLQAYNAKEPTSARSMMTYIREYFARVKMFFDIWTDKRPSNLEDGQPLGQQIFEGRFNSDTFWRDINTIDAHNEQDTIVGNFTGKGIDTLYVRMVERASEMTGEHVSFYMSSTNKLIPDIELYGFASAPPKLVNEGDLDDNGTCEVGYLHTWMNSQWRYYRIFTLRGKEWRYLVSGDYLDTPEWFRHSGVEVAEPGKKKGTVLIHHYYEGYDDIKEERIAEIRDTIVKPTFDIISD